MAKKKTTGIKTEDVEKYKNLLLEKMKEIIGDVATIEENIFQGGGELSSMPVHMADLGSDSFEQEFSLGLMAEEKKILAEIRQALIRIDNGTFGVCEGLGIPIEKNRLEAIPWTRYSLEYARMKEKGQENHGMRRRPIDIQREDELDREAEEEPEAAEDEEEIDLDDIAADTEFEEGAEPEEY